MAQIRDDECCICYNPRIEGVVDCRRCVAFVCQECIAKISPADGCPVCKNPGFVPTLASVPTIDSDMDFHVRSLIDDNLWRRYGAQASRVSVNISLAWREPVQQTPVRNPRAAEDVTPQPERQHQFRCGEYRVSTRNPNTQGWYRNPNESALPFRITKVNRSSIHFVNLADEHLRDICKRVQYDGQRYYVPMGQRYRLYDN
jgi:hypothetical protein